MNQRSFSRRSTEIRLKCLFSWSLEINIGAIFADMSGLPGTLSGPLEDGLSLLQSTGLPGGGFHLLPSAAYATTNFPSSSQPTIAAHNFFNSATPTSSYGHQQQQQQQQYLESPSLFLASQPLLRPHSLQHQLASLVQPGSNLPGSLVQPTLPLNLNYLNFSLLNSLSPLQAQGIKVREVLKLPPVTF